MRSALRMRLPRVLALLVPVGLVLLGACAHGSGHRTSTGGPVASSTPSGSGPSVPATAAAGGVTFPAAWTTYQHDASRSGAAPDRIGADLRRVWTSPTLDGAVYAQPLLIGDAVIVATERDSLYRLDAATGAVRWRINLGEPVPLGELPCGNIDPIGITGTPVADTAASLVWAVAFVEPHRHDLVAVDLSSGTLRRRQAIDPTGADPSLQLQRTALTLSGGRVYVGFGGLYGDCGPFHGWVVAASVAPSAAGAAPISWQVPAGRGAGIWAPGGPVVDAAGRLYVATGNSFNTNASVYDDSNSVIALSPDLVPLSTFAPANWARLNRVDSDLGSTGPALVSNGLVFQIGKAGTGFLLSADHLGGVNGALFQAPVCPGGGGYGATAWAAPVLYVPCTDGLRAVVVNGQSFVVVWRGPRADVGPPVVTADSVWVVDLGAGQLVRLDPARGKVEERLSVGPGPVPHFAAPAVGGGRVVVPSGRGVVAFAA